MLFFFSLPSLGASTAETTHVYVNKYGITTHVYVNKYGIRTHVCVNKYGNFRTHEEVLSTKIYHPF